MRKEPVLEHPTRVIPLGEILLSRGLITKPQFIAAIKEKQRSGSRLGEVLVAEGILTYKTLYEALAEHYRLGFIDLFANPPSARLCNINDVDLYLSLGFIPYAREDNKTVLACCEVSEEIMRWARSRYGNHFSLVLTSPLDVHRSAETLFGANLEETSRLKLWLASPEQSARATIEPKQGAMVAVLIVLCILALWFTPFTTASLFLLACQAIFAASMLFKWVLFTQGARMYERIYTVMRATPLPKDHDLPVYTLLLPVYKEAGSLPGLFAAIERLDYPKSKLDVKLIVEEDDAETYQAAIALKPPYYYEIIRVPYSLPKTKPKACNYALRFARGDYVCIYDAEDFPSRRQLRRAVAVFRQAAPDVVCLQARLNYYNADENWLTRMFTLEYTVLFDFTLPGLQALDMPIPLGGTSNHIAIHKLREMGEWDPYNVTEDADIGIRLARSGYRTEVLSSWTLEESPIHLGAWMKQRTRWLKGYMQTWLVHMRSPAQLYRRLGPRGFFGFQMMIGIACFTFLVAPVLWALSLLWIIKGMPAALTLNGLVYPLSIFTLLLQFAVHWHMAFVAAKRHRSDIRRSLRRSALWYPLYPVLAIFASYRALWHLLIRPHLWEKTTHGLTRMQPNSKSSG